MAHSSCSLSAYRFDSTLLYLPIELSSCSICPAPGVRAHLGARMENQVSVFEYNIHCPIYHGTSVHQSSYRLSEIVTRNICAIAREFCCTERWLAGQSCSIPTKSSAAIVSIPSGLEVGVSLFLSPLNALAFFFCCRPLVACFSHRLQVLSRPTLCCAHNLFFRSVLPAIFYVFSALARVH